MCSGMKCIGARAGSAAGAPIHINTDVITKRLWPDKGVIIGDLRSLSEREWHDPDETCWISLCSMGDRN